MNGVLETAVHVQAFCDSRGWRSCFIGGIAVQRWGEPRVTRDVDLSLLAGFGREDGYIDALMEAYTARIGNAREFALTRRVLLLQSKDGVGIDISLAAIPFEQGVVARASTFDFGAGLAIRTCSAEDLVVLKLFASRPLDIRDAEGVAVRQGDRLDWDHIKNELAPLAEAKEEPEIMQVYARLRGRGRAEQAAEAGGGRW